MIDVLQTVLEDLHSLVLDLDGYDASFKYDSAYDCIREAIGYIREAEGLLE